MQAEKTESENRMGTWPINKLLLAVAIPLILSYLMQALYNMVDSLYVSRLSQTAFNAVSLAYPVQNIMNAIQSGTGIGLVALISKALGEKNHEKANRLAATGVFLAGCSYVIMLMFGLFGTDIFFRSQTNVPEIIEGGKTYLAICCIFSFGQFGQVVIENLMQSTGNSKLSMWTQLTGAVVNIVLDPILIFGWGPFPKLGVAGAAVATVTGQVLGMILGLILNHHYNKDIHLKFKGFRPDGKTILSIYKIGVPSMLTIGIGSVMTFMMNRLLMSAARQLVLLVPIAYLLGYTLGYEYIWFAIPIGELGSLAMAIYGRFRMQKRLFNRMPDVIITIARQRT